MIDVSCDDGKCGWGKTIDPKSGARFDLCPRCGSAALSYAEWPGPVEGPAGPMRVVIPKEKILRLEDRQDGMGEAVLAALAASAGFATSKPWPDRSSVDLTIEATTEYISRSSTIAWPKIGVQLKSPIRRTTEVTEDCYKHRISASNYNALSGKNPGHSVRLLVVVAIDEEEERWLHCQKDWIEVHCWLLYKSLRGAPPLSPDATTKTIELPYKNQLTAKRLQELMVLVGEGRWSEASDGD